MVAVKGQRMNPNSLANLRPFQPGEAPNPLGNPKPGPKIAPAMHRYAAMPWEDLMALAADEKRASKLPVADVIAITALIKAAKDVGWGDAAREFVANRLDGNIPKGDVLKVDVGVLVRYIEGSAHEE